MLSRRKLCALFAAAPIVLAPAAVLAAPVEKKKGGGLSFIQLQTLTATIFRPDGRRGVMTVEVGLDIPNTGLHDRTVLMLPRLRAAFVQFLQIYAAGLGPGVPPDADYLARSLQNQTNQLLRQPGAKLLLGSILVN
jgi:hypothetical protein